MNIKVKPAHEPSANDDPGFVLDDDYENPFPDWPEFAKRAPGPAKKTRAKKAPR